MSESLREDEVTADSMFPAVLVKQQSDHCRAPETDLLNKFGKAADFSFIVVNTCRFLL